MCVRVFVCLFVAANVRRRVKSVFVFVENIPISE